MHVYMYVYTYSIHYIHIAIPYILGKVWQHVASYVACVARRAHTNTNMATGANSSK